MNPEQRAELAEFLTSYFVDTGILNQYELQYSDNEGDPWFLNSSTVKIYLSNYLEVSYDETRI